MGKNSVVDLDALLYTDNGKLSLELRAMDRLRWGILLLLPLYFMILGAIIDGPAEVILGLSEILLSSARVTTDFTAVGGLGATLWSVSLVILMQLILLFIWDSRLSNRTASGILFTAGFAFHDTNVMNAFPIMLGVYLYSRIRKIPYNDLFFVASMSTSMGPLISTLFYDRMIWSEGSVMPWLNWIRNTEVPSFGISYILHGLCFILFGLFLGFLIGAILPLLAEATAKFHRGYTLYNVGFAAGIYSMIAFFLLRGWGLDFGKEAILGDIPRLHAMLTFIPVYLAFIILGLLQLKGKFSDYFALLKSSGVGVDFEEEYGMGATLFNMGIMGFSATLFLCFVTYTFNGPVLGSLLSMVAFSAIGQHPGNCWPIVLACVLTQHFRVGLGGGAMAAVFFSTNMAPFAGEFGILAGLMAGYLHAILVGQVLNLHAGLNLYNNGFSSGFVVVILYPIFHLWREGFAKRNQDKQGVENAME